MSHTRTILAWSAALYLGATCSAVVAGDPVAPDGYLKGAATDEGDAFGARVALSGDTLVVGVPEDDSIFAGVGGDPTNNDLGDSGAAYVFVRDGGGWSQQAYLKASNPGSLDRFGSAVAIHGDTIVVGAPEENGGATGVDGDGLDDSASNAGAAYVFVRDGTTWSQQAYLKASNTDANDQFGFAVDVHGDTVVVGAWSESSGSAGVNGDETDDSEGWSGAAYVFTRSGATWTQQAYLKASNPDALDNFGWSVAAHGDTVAVGARGERSGASGLDGDQANNDKIFAGAAYVFTRSGATWSQQAYVKASNTNRDDVFGEALALSGDTLVVGAPGEGSDATGVGGDQLDNDADFSGAAYVFTRSGTTWSQQAYVKASNTAGLDRFGSTLGLSGDALAVGATGEGSGATDVNGLQSDDGTLGAGAVYLYERDGGLWTQRAYLKSADTDVADDFGEALALDGGLLAVGAPREDGSATGIGGDPTDDGATNAGAAFAFDLEATWGTSGPGLPGASGAPRLVGGGELTAASANQVDLSEAAPSAVAGLFLALDPVTPAPFKQGTLVPVPTFKVLFATTSPTGTIPLPFVWPAGAPPGFGFHAQWAVTDAGAPAGIALSNAVQGSVP